MKIKIYHSPDGWRWQIAASNGRTVAIGEAYERPQKLVQTLMTYIIRDDEKLKAIFNESLAANGLDPRGNQMKVPVSSEKGVRWTEMK